MTSSEFHRGFLRGLFDAETAQTETTLVRIRHDDEPQRGHLGRERPVARIGDRIAGPCCNAWFLVPRSGGRDARATAWRRLVLQCGATSPRKDAPMMSLSPAAPPDAHRVVIVGSGFGGLFATRRLNGAPVQVTLIDRRTHHDFHKNTFIREPGHKEHAIRFGLGEYDKKRIRVTPLEV